MSTTDSPDGPTRVEREILEILERADAQVTPVADFQAAVRRRGVRARAGIPAPARPRWAPDWSPDLARIAIALVLAILAAMFSSVSNFLAVMLAMGSGLALFSLWFRRGPGGPSDRPRWRGQDLDPPRSSMPFGGGDRPSWRWPRRPGA